MVLARPRAVEDDEPQRAEIGRVLHRLTVRAGNAEVTAQREAVVMVAGQDEERWLERRQPLAYLLVLDIGGMVYEVTRDQHRVRPRLERQDGLDRGGEHRDGIPAAPVRADVGIAELDEQKGSLHGTS